ncbi:hypothetical protein MNBD_GAMMA25-2063 [hydrothermal vent metagenome]|uniref:Tyr recombinase domain-containing protein n=1 Tax=hydrothermal vent metagenome TaxID=652676 RepID=A0A3B1AZZ1_9ZZZZ
MAEIIDLPLKKAPRPPTVNGKVRPPTRQSNSKSRSREYLTHDEVERLMKAARGLGRHGHRDATLILIAYRHALRVSELVALRWDQVNLKDGHLYVNRNKNGVPSTHPLHGPEIRALRSLQRDYPEIPHTFSSLNVKAH